MSETPPEAAAEPKAQDPAGLFLTHLLFSIAQVGPMFTQAVDAARSDIYNAHNPVRVNDAMARATSDPRITTSDMLVLGAGIIFSTVNRLQPLEKPAALGAVLSFLHDYFHRQANGEEVVSAPAEAPAPAG